MIKLTDDNRELDESNPWRRLVNDTASNMFNLGEPDDSSAVPVFFRRSFVDDIYDEGKGFDGWIATLDRWLIRFMECQITISFTKIIFVKPKIDFLSHKVTGQDPQSRSAYQAQPFGD